VSLVTANLFGAALVAVAWWGSSGSDTIAPQLTWLNVSLGGFGIASVANGLWFAQGRRMVSLARTAAFPPPASWRCNGSLRGTDSAAQAGYETDGLVSGPHMTRYHLSSCALVAGKDVRLGSPMDHELAGRTACEICRP
jgi:hypothetical protein